jgi:hypothetical protein
MLADLIQYLGDTFDKPGRAVRGAIGGRPDELAALIPFSDTLGLTDPSRALSGKDLATQTFGSTGSEFGDAVLGFGVGVATDPTTYVGLGPLTRALGGMAGATRSGAVQGFDEAVDALARTPLPKMSSMPIVTKWGENPLSLIPPPAAQPPAQLAQAADLAAPAREFTGQPLPAYAGTDLTPTVPPLDIMHGMAPGTGRFGFTASPHYDEMLAGNLTPDKALDNYNRAWGDWTNRMRAVGDYNSRLPEAEFGKAITAPAWMEDALRLRQDELSLLTGYAERHDTPALLDLIRMDDSLRQGLKKSMESQHYTIGDLIHGGTFDDPKMGSLLPDWNEATRQRHASLRGDLRALGDATVLPRRHAVEEGDMGSEQMARLIGRAGIPVDLGLVQRAAAKAQLDDVHRVVRDYAVRADETMENFPADDVQVMLPADTEGLLKMLRGDTMRATGDLFWQEITSDRTRPLLEAILASNNPGGIPAQEYAQTLAEVLSRRLPGDP